MSEDLVIRHCAPTLAGIKTGNLFSCACPCKAALTKELCRLNRKLVPKGIRALPLRVQKGRALIYVYRPNALECDLADHCSRGLLLQYGYTPEDSNRCVIHLIQRLRSDNSPMRSACFSAIRRRMSWVSFSIKRAITSALAAGRSTVMNKRPSVSFEGTKNAAKSIPSSGNRGSPSSSSR